MASKGLGSLDASPDARRIYVVSYYDSAVAIFELDDQGNYQFMQAIRDCLPYDKVFIEKE
jgi:hypothetical protein